MFSRKIRHVAIRNGSIRWISISFDAPSIYPHCLFYLNLLFYVRVTVIGKQTKLVNQALINSAWLIYDILVLLTI